MDREERRLRWVQENRTRGHRSQRVGDVARSVMAGPRLTGPAWRRRLSAVLLEHAGSALVNHIRLAGLRRGVLYIEVTEPAVLYHLRLKWERRLVDLLRSEVPEAGVQAVRFSVGGSER